ENSLRATARASSPGSISPFSTVQCPSFRWTKNGPPGCPKSTSTLPRLQRHRRRPALTRPRLSTFGFFGFRTMDAMMHGNGDQIEEIHMPLCVALICPRDHLVLELRLRRPRGLDDPHTNAGLTRFLP